MVGYIQIEDVGASAAAEIVVRKSTLRVDSYLLFV